VVSLEALSHKSIPTHFSILVADDDSGYVQSVIGHLNRLAQRFGDSIDSYPAYSALDALAILSKHRIDVLFLDYHFKGGMTGADVLDRIEDRFGDMLIILMSEWNAEVLDRVIIEGRRSLGDRFKFLRKPFDFIEIQDKYLEIKLFFSGRPYPFSLAYTYDALLACSTFQGQITAMRNLTEAIAKYSLSILLADVYRLGLADEFAARTSWRVDRELRVWVTWLQDVVMYLLPKQEAVFMPELIHLYEEGHNGGYLGLMYEFASSLQDVGAGEEFAREENWYALLVEKNLEPLQSLYSDCAFTSRYNLLIREKLDFADNDEYEYQVRLLMGAETRFGLTPLRSQYRLRRGEVYLFDPSGQCLSLYPFWVYAFCEQCSQSRLFMLEEIQPGKILYNTFCNHRLFSGESKSCLNERFGGLFTVRHLDPYQVMDTVRETDHSEIVKAWDTDLGRMVALKTFRISHGIHDESAKKQLLREARLLAQFDHPNIGKVYNLLHEPLRVVMEWVDGSSLKDILDSGEKLTAKETIHIAIKLSDALRYAHERGVTHRDIKPGNIIVDNDLEPVLIDFDIARVSALETISRQRDGSYSYVGTRRYSAPEQFINPEEVGPSADLFSLGLVLYELLAHQLPYEYGNNPSLYVDNHFPKPEQYDIPEPLYDLLCKLLSGRPEQRPDAATLKAELENCLVPMGTDH